jgi:hypothetical protein
MLNMQAETPPAASNAAPATRCRDPFPGLRPAVLDRHSRGSPCIVTGTDDRPSPPANQGDHHRALDHATYSSTADASAGQIVAGQAKNDMTCHRRRGRD